MILEDLWSGRFYPAETVVPTNPKYREVNRAISETMECLQAQLPREQFTLVEQVLEQIALQRVGLPVGQHQNGGAGRGHHACVRGEGGHLPESASALPPG